MNGGTLAVSALLFSDAKQRYSSQPTAIVRAPPYTGVEYLRPYLTGVHVKRSQPQHQPTPGLATVTDPVCGMSVELATARPAGLTSVHAGVEYGFCGRGCRLEFEDDPATYLSPDYVPAM